jgi:hypothetical protein
VNREEVVVAFSLLRGVYLGCFYWIGPYRGGICIE